MLIRPGTALHTSQNVPRAGHRIQCKCFGRYDALLAAVLPSAPPSCSSSLCQDTSNLRRALFPPGVTQPSLVVFGRRAGQRDPADSDDRQAAAVAARDRHPSAQHHLPHGRGGVAFPHAGMKRLHNGLMCARYLYVVLYN